jgi:RimJ/RimL family protein N-acetyltransferase
VSSLLDYAFNKMGLHRIGLHLLSDNYVALKFYKKCGFLLEGTMKKHVFKDGVFKNVVIMGICRDDYLDSQASDR